MKIIEPINMHPTVKSILYKLKVYQRSRKFVIEDVYCYNDVKWYIECFRKRLFRSPVEMGFSIRVLMDSKRIIINVTDPIYNKFACYFGGILDLYNGYEVIVELAADYLSE